MAFKQFLERNPSTHHKSSSANRSLSAFFSKIRSACLLFNLERAGYQPALDKT
jgi:hypothetical protein